MRFIVPTGYFNTGSSAVTDLLKEFSDIRVPDGGLEWRFLQDPDGVRALEYNLIEHNHRHNTSHAIKRFKKMCKITEKKWYRISVGSDFSRATERYLNNIVELESETYWHYDNFEKDLGFKILSRLYYNFVNRYNKIFGKTNSTNLLRKVHEMGYYTALSKEDFYKYTKQYIEEIFSFWDDREYIVADQLIPISNIDSYVNYFNEKPKVIIVDRDPRDIYLQGRVEELGVCPQDVEEWVKWFEIIRRDRETKVLTNENVMLVQFEDLIYQYDVTVQKIVNFIGTSNEKHIKPRKYLIPEVSKKNTNLSSQYPQYANDVKYIEEKLADYLYDFEKYH